MDGNQQIAMAELHKSFISQPWSLEIAKRQRRAPGASGNHYESFKLQSKMNEHIEFGAQIHMPRVNEQ